MTRSDVVELDDRWRFPLAGLTVTQVRVDHQLGLRLGEDAEINVETDAAMDHRDGGPTTPLVPERQEVAAALGLIGRAVTEVTALKDGRLLVEFDQGTRLTVAADADFEAWNITGPDTFRVVCMPGGELAIWR
ncbi:MULTISPECIES: DUF6188 family protein [unclassified Streptomyces]|uniref:DUF6188 family protein n=1 Tax=unclassified Streptomyces TaxID=2593676 RepID=UPI0033C50E2A